MDRTEEAGSMQEGNGTLSETRKGRGAPTLRTLAAITGYSVTAVSRALKDAPDIGEETKKIVRAAADKVGYRPNRAGVRLRTGKTQVISLVLNTNEEFMGLTAMMISGILERLGGTSYHLIVTPFSHDDDPLDPVRYVVETQSADGVILSQIEPEDRRVAYLSAQKLPFVTHGRTSMGLVHPWYDFDNERFAHDSVLALAARGVRRVGLLGPSQKLTYGRHMRTGLRRAIASLGLESFHHDEVLVENRLDAIEESWTRVFRSGNYPDGVVCGAGASAVAMISAIEAAGLVVGRDVHVAAKQSSPVLTRFRPSIYAVNEDFRDAGRQVADLLIRAIDGGPHEDLHILTYPGA